MIEQLTALLRYTQAALDISFASNAQVTVLLVGAIGAVAVALRDRLPRDAGLVAADRSGASRRLRQTTDPGRLIAQSHPTRQAGPAPGRPDAASRPRSDFRPSAPPRSPRRLGRRIRSSRPDGSRIPRPQGTPMDPYAFPPIAALLDGAHSMSWASPACSNRSSALERRGRHRARDPSGARRADPGRPRRQGRATRARLAPQLADLRRRHSTNPERLQRETMALYAEREPRRSPAACRCSSRRRSWA